MTISRALGLLLALLTALLQDGGAFKFDAKNQQRDESQRNPPNPWTSVKSSKDDAALKRILPLVSFECKGKTGYFADAKFDCEVFHYCKPDGSRNTFHCPAKSIFNQKLMVCEVKTSLNSHLCKEIRLGDYKTGKIATLKMTQTLNPESRNFSPETKQKQSNYGRTSEHHPLAAAANNSTSGSLKVMMTLEDLLSYMNLDFGSKTDAKNANRQPSFVSTFHQPSADYPEKTALNTKEFHRGNKKNPNLTSKQIKQSSNAQSPPKSENQTPGNNPEDVDIAKSLQQSKRRQNRDSSRKGRVLNFDESTGEGNVGEEEPRPPHHGYSHVSVRSPSENNGNYGEDEERQMASSERGFDYRDVEGHGEDMTRTPTSLKAPRLFSVSPSRRNATRGSKKRRRFFRRRKKQRKSGIHLSTVSEEVISDGGDSGRQTHNESIVDVTPRSNRDRHFLSPVDHSIKSDGENGWQGFSRLAERQKDPPSQPPPPHPSSAPVALPQTDKRDEKPKEKHLTRFEGIDSNSNSSRSNGTSGNDKNPWFKGFTATADDKGNFRFGDRTASGPGSAIEPFYGDEIESSDVVEFHEEGIAEVANGGGHKGSHGGHQVSEEVVHGKKQERVESQQRPRNPSDRERAPTRKTHAQYQDPRPTVRIREKESSSGWRVSGGERDRKQEAAPHTLFPPPRAPMTSQASSGGNSDSRWNTFVPPMQKDERHRFTTPYPPLSTPPEVRPYHPDLHHAVEVDSAGWEGMDHHEDLHKQKIRVGSSFAKSRGRTTTTSSTTTTTTTTTTVPPKIIPPSVPPFVKNLHRNRKKEWPKHTAAHQQLSKMLNDFFGLSSKHPDILNFNTESHLSPHQLKPVTPRYRIPNEDIYESEPKPKERIKLPPGLLEFVESYTSEKPREKKKQKIKYQIHEHVDLKEPLSELLDAEVKKIFSTEKPKQTLQVKDIPGLLKEALAVKQTSVPKQKDDLKEFADIAKFAYMHLEPLLSSVLSSEKSSSVTSSSKDKTSNRARRPAVITAQKVPIKVIYADNLRNMDESRPFGMRIHPNVRILRPNIPRQNFQPAVQSSATMVPSPSSEVVVLHPPSLRPPHPPPLPPRNFSPMNRAAMNHRRAALKPMTQNLRYFPYRRRRSRRQKRQINQQFSPFANNFFPSFNPNVFTTLPSFRNLFGSQRGLTSNGRSSLRFPFGFPSPGGTLRPTKPNGGRQPVFLPRQPVQTIPQPAPQTVIVEEVPVPVPIPVPDHSPPQRRPPGRSPHPGGILHPPPGPRNPTPTTFRQPRIFPQLGVFGPNQPGRPILNGNSPPAVLPPRLPPGIPHSLSSGIRDQPLAFAIPVTSGPFPFPGFPSRPNQSPGRNIPGGSGPLKIPLQAPLNDRKPPQPPHLSPPFEVPEFVKVNSYPNFPYFQSGPHSHTPINHPGSENHSKLMHSGYKPPQQSPESSRPPTPGQNHYPRPRPEVIPHVEYVELPPPPEEKPSDYGVTQSSGGLFVVSPPDAKTLDHGHHKHQENIRLLPSKPNLDDDSKESGEMAVPKQRLTGGGSSSSSSEEVTGRRRRPGARRRRPRPSPPSDIPPYVHSDGAENNGPTEISVTPAPPQQIPPPPSEFTSGPFRPSIQHSVNDVRSGLQQLSLGGPLNSELTTVEAQGLYPPAGYYGREQLSQFFDPSAFVGENRDNSRPFSFGGLPHQQPTEIHTPTSTESSTSQEEPPLDDDETETGKVPFGTRLRSRDRSRGSARSKVTSPSGSQSGQVERSNKRQRNREANDQGSRQRPVRLRDPDPENKQRQNGRDENQQQRRKPGGFRHQASVDRPQAIYDLQGVQPDVIYYDPRDQQMRYYNTPGVDSEIRLPSTSSQQSNQRDRDIYTVPQPYLNGGTYNTPPTSQPEYNTRYINIPGKLPEPHPQQKEPITSSNGNVGFGMLFSAPQGGFVPSTPPGSSLAEKQNQQQSPRNRERKRQTLPPPVKNENRPHSTVSTTKSRPKPTPSLYHSRQQHRQNQDHPQQQHRQNQDHHPQQQQSQNQDHQQQQRQNQNHQQQRQNQDHQQQPRQNQDHHQQQQRQNQDHQQQQRKNQYHHQQQQPQPSKPRDPSTPSRWQGSPTASPTTTTTTATTTHVYRPTTSHNNPDNIKKESEGGFKPSNPPSSQESTKPFLDGKVEIQKINATTSISVSVSGLNTTESQEQQPKRVFSSKNGGLAVVRKGPRQRKRVRTQKVATSTSKSEESNSSENGLNNDERLQIAASILDIIKATTETEKQQGSSTSSSKSVANHTVATNSSKTAKSWILQPPLESVQLNKES